MSIASAFLSHSSQDKPLVEAVAEALGQRGILPWVDQYNLSIGIDLEKSIKQAISNQAVLVLFLSPDSLKSEWVKKELEHAIQLEQQGQGVIFPVFLGNPLTLISSSQILKDHWLDSNGQLVNRLGVSYQDLLTADSPARTVITTKIAQGLYERLGLKKAQRVALAIDQRGEGKRIGSCFDLIPEETAKKLPSLIFRPDPGTRHRWDTMTGETWKNFCRNLEKSLSEALGTLKDKEIHLFGNAQLGVAYFLGKHFDRASGATLICYNTRVTPHTKFSNEGQGHWGDDCAAELPSYRVFLTQGGKMQPGKLDPFQEYPKISLYIGAPKYFPDVKIHAAHHTPELPLLVIQSGHFYTSAEVLGFIEQIIAFIQYFKSKTDFATRTIRLYSSLPFNMMALLAASLTHEIEVEFMEYRYDRKEEGCDPHELYTQLSMRRIPPA